MSLSAQVNGLLESTKFIALTPDFDSSMNNVKNFLDQAQPRLSDWYGREVTIEGCSDAVSLYDLQKKVMALVYKITNENESCPESVKSVVESLKSLCDRAEEVESKETGIIARIIIFIRWAFYGTFPSGFDCATWLNSAE